MPELRLVTFDCPETGKRYEFLTNIRHLAASTIAAIYKSRWQIELFFKFLKQNLKLKGFYGTTRNAVLTQIWIALCVALMVAYLKFRSATGLSCQQILAPPRHQPVPPPRPPRRSCPREWCKSAGHSHEVKVGSGRAFSRCDAPRPGVWIIARPSRVSSVM